MKVILFLSLVSCALAQATCTEANIKTDAAWLQQANWVAQCSGNNNGGCAALQSQCANPPTAPIPNAAGAYSNYQCDLLACSQGTVAGLCSTIPNGKRNVTKRQDETSSHVTPLFRLTVNASKFAPLSPMRNIDWSDLNPNPESKYTFTGKDGTEHENQNPFYAATPVQAGQKLVMSGKTATQQGLNSGAIPIPFPEHKYQVLAGQLREGNSPFTLEFEPGFSAYKERWGGIYEDIGAMRIASTLEEDQNVAFYSFAALPIQLLSRWADPDAEQVAKIQKAFDLMLMPYGSFRIGQKSEFQRQLDNPFEIITGIDWYAAPEPKN